MFTQPAVLVDIETNGGSGPRGRIIEVAAIKVVDGEIVDSFSSLVNPGSTIPVWITRLTGIENQDLVSAPYFEDIAEQLLAFMEGVLFVAHNVTFDYSFLKREFKNLGIDYRPQLFCTVRMSRALYPSVRGHSLQAIISRHKIAVSNRHRAYDDALVLYDYIKLAVTQQGQAVFLENVALQLKTRSLPPNVDEAVILNLPDTPGVYIFEDDTGAPLYVGKSINLRTRVRSHFANATMIAKEMKMSLQSHNITYIQTETEIEALLLESAKVKELQPIYNKKLRRQTKQVILEKTLAPQAYLTIDIKVTDLASEQDMSVVYGVYQTKTQAKNSLESIARTYQLCPKLLGLEKTKSACFRYQLGLCKGACIGKESASSYNQRLEFALDRTKIESWPFPSSIILRISSTRSIVIDQWVATELVEHSFEPVHTRLENGFDIDTYKIIRSFIRKQPHLISHGPS